VITDRRGITIAFLLTSANVHDSVPFEHLLHAVPPVAGKPGRPKSRPDKLHADKLDRNNAFTSIACSIICLRALAGRV
jgi:hypothetical protein